MASFHFTSNFSTVSIGQAVNITWAGGDESFPVTITLFKSGVNGPVKILTSSATAGSYTWIPDASLAVAADYSMEIQQGESHATLEPMSVAAASSAATTTSSTSASTTPTSAPTISSSDLPTISSGSVDASPNVEIHAISAAAVVAVCISLVAVVSILSLIIFLCIRRRKRRRLRQFGAKGNPTPISYPRPQVQMQGPPIQGQGFPGRAQQGFAELPTVPIGSRNYHGEQVELEDTSVAHSPATPLERQSSALSLTPTTQREGDAASSSVSPSHISPSSSSDDVSAAGRAGHGRAGNRGGEGEAIVPKEMI